MTTTVWTIGHSNRSIEEFLALLATFAIGAIADVRRHPGSRRLPQFGREALAQALEARGIAYVWLPALGGRRRPRPDSRNDAWENESFRGYADHLESDEFASGLVELVNTASALPTAIMCAEALWWRCHRRIVADVLVARGFDVVHILGAHDAAAHAIAPPARLVNGQLTYATAD